MRVPCHKLLVAAGIVGLASVGPARCAARADDSKPEWSRAQLEFFEKQVRPLLVERCYECHGAGGDDPDGGLRLTTRADVLQGGDSGAAVKLGDPDASRLIQAVRYGDPLLKMPPKQKLSEREIEILVEWVRQGVPDPRVGNRSLAPATPATEISAEERGWWSFQPARQPELPTVEDAAWCQNDIDHFILARLEKHEMRPAPPADKATLIRRATFDLIGLPPTPAEVEAFVSDESPEAFAKVVDRLLASEQYGERWGRHWLDVVRYADTSGCNSDYPMPEAYRYRNYVIDSFNCDKPFDAFVREQIAGDLLPAETEAQRYEQVIATGYLAISRRFSSAAEEYHLTLDDTLDNLGKAFLGLSISCSRCHDHKFDSVPQCDYYALYGIFQSTKYAFPGTEIYRHMHGLTPLVAPERFESDVRPWLERVAALDAKIFEIHPQIMAQDTGEEKQKLKKRHEAYKVERDELVKARPDFPAAYAASEAEPVDVRMHLKGNPATPGAVVPRGFLQILGGQQLSPGETGSGRLQLAKWLTDPQNPLVPRVFVNRVWQQHFGAGIVHTPDDFGTRGTLPTHPELLDCLTSEFVQSAWSLKRLHRLLMLSATYQMASRENVEYALRDPQNDLLWTFGRRRLSAEEIRDAVLAVSGALDHSRGGPHPFPQEIEWRYTQHRPFVDDYPTSRRSVYMLQPRIRLQAYLGVFDGADTNAATGVRKLSTSPQQALFMLNSEFAHGQATIWAERLKAAFDDPRARIDLAYWQAFARAPRDAEVEEGLSYLSTIAGDLGRAGLAEREVAHAAWASYLRVLLSSNEFVFVD